MHLFKHGYLSFTHVVDSPFYDGPAGAPKWTAWAGSLLCIQRQSKVRHAHTAFTNANMSKYNVLRIPYCLTRGLNHPQKFARNSPREFKNLPFIDMSCGKF